MQNAINIAWHILQKDTKYGRLFGEKPQFIYRKRKSIGNYLLHSDTAFKKNMDAMSRYTDKKGMYPCHNCVNCTSIIKGPNVRHPIKGFEIPLRGYHTCNSQGIVYLLKGPCRKEYVGQTSRAIR